MSNIDQTRAAVERRTTANPEFQINARDRLVLRRLAGQVAELAARPVEGEKRALWYMHNALEATRPLVFCDPENGWNEIIPPAQLECQGELARQWEMRLRKEIFWGQEMGDDRVVEPHFEVAHVYADSGWGLYETKVGGQDGGSYVWDAPLKDYVEDFERLRTPQIAVDRTATARIEALARETLGDLLTVRLRTSWWWTLGMTWTLITLRGLGQMMFDMVDRPDDLHRLMAFLRDGHLAKLDFLE